MTTNMITTIATITNMIMIRYAYHDYVYTYNPPLRRLMMTTEITQTTIMDKMTTAVMTNGIAND